MLLLMFNHIYTTCTHKNPFQPISDLEINQSHYWNLQTRMGRNQESADQEQSEEDIPCCNVGVSRAWGPEDPEPRHICPAAKCCGHLSTKVYVDSDLTVYEICVSDVVCYFIYFF